MRCFYRIFRLIVATEVFGSLSSFTGAAPGSPEQLRSILESALVSKDTNAILALFDTECKTNGLMESNATKEMPRNYQTLSMLKATNITVKLAPIPSGFSMQQTNEQNGTLTKFNVNVVGMIEVRGRGEVHQLPYGRKGASFYIAEACQEQIPGKRLSVRVLAGPNTDFLTYTGRCVYVRNGQENMVEITDKTNLFVTLWGDYVKACEIRRTSTHEAPGFATWFYFQINEGGANVFESPELTNEDLFIYQRKYGQ
jgi:hypothetical protein